MIYDITPMIDENFPVWPGDMQFKKEIKQRSSNIYMSSHIGAHTDAPSHCFPDDDGIENVNLEHYVGACQVIRVCVQKNAMIEMKHLNKSIIASRVIFATHTYSYGTEFHTDFAALSPRFVDELFKQGVTTIGIDTPSIDLFDSKELYAHRTAFRNKMSILEGLQLKDIQDGIYELIALPLKLKGIDGSPVRAVLRTIAQ